MTDPADQCHALIWLYDKWGEGVSFVCKFPRNHPNHNGTGAHPHTYTEA